MKTFSSFCAFMLLLILASCRWTGTKYITILNKSEKTIGLQVRWTMGIKNESPIYQDYLGVYKIPKDSSYLQPSGSFYGWEDDFELIPFIRFLVMDYDAYEQHRKYGTASVDSIRKYVPIYHCFDLTLEDLQAMNWTVVYPPKE